MEEPTSLLQNKKILIGGGAFILVILILVSVLVAGKKNQQSTSPVGENKVLATVGDKKIYSNDVQNLAKQQYGGAANDAKVVQSVLDKTKKRAIMDIEASKANIQVTTDEIKAAIKYQFPQGYDSIPDTFKESIKYILLENKLTAKYVDSRTAYVIGYWVPPTSSSVGYTADQNATFAQQRQAGPAAMNEVLARIQHGDEPLRTATTINKNYPAMKSVMGVNGYIVDTTTDLYPMSIPRVYIYQQQSNTKSLFDTMFNSKIGDIRKVESEEGSGSFVIKVIAVNSSQYKTFDAWLQSKAADLVK